MNKNAFKLHREVELLKIEFKLRNFDKGTELFWDLRSQLDAFGGISSFDVEILIGQMNYGAVIEQLSKIQQVIANELFQFQCEKSWYSLEPTGEDKVRFCGDCHKHVYRVEDEQELEARSRAGQCTAILFKYKDKDPGSNAGCQITYFDDELMGLPF